MPSRTKYPRMRLPSAVGGDDGSRVNRLNANREGGSGWNGAPLLIRHRCVPVAACGAGFNATHPSLRTVSRRAGDNPSRLSITTLYMQCSKNKSHSGIERFLHLPGPRDWAPKFRSACGSAIVVRDLRRLGLN
jgi:hypothetical protein